MESGSLLRSSQQFGDDDRDLFDDSLQMSESTFDTSLFDLVDELERAEGGLVA